MEVRKFRVRYKKANGMHQEFSKFNQIQPNSLNALLYMGFANFADIVLNSCVWSFLTYQLQHFCKLVLFIGSLIVVISESCLEKVGCDRISDEE